MSTIEIPPPTAREAKDTLEAPGPKIRTSAIQNLVVKLRPARVLPLWIRYLITIALIFLCFSVRYFLKDLYPSPFLLFLPAVILVSFLFDRGTGIFATLLSAFLAVYFFIEPEVRFVFKHAGHTAWLFTFLFIGILMSAVIEALRVSVDELADANARLENSRSRYKAILNSAVDAIIIIDDRGIIKSFNPAAEQIFGFKTEEAIGRNVNILMPESEARRHDGYIANYRQTGIAKIIGIGREVEGQRKDGSRVPLHLSIAEWRDVNGNRFFTGIMRDITVLKQEETRLHHYMEELEESNRNLDDFVYIVSHDLKEPVRGINNFASFLLEDYGGKLEKEGREQLETLKSMSMRMQELVSDLLHFAIIGRESTATAEENPVSEIVANVLELMKIQLEKNNAKIIVKDPLPVAVCNKGHLAEIFRNLIVNGVKYNESEIKKIEIGCTRENERHPGKNVFYVRDNGIGIPEDQKDNIFKMFKRLHGREKYGGGTGSGLAIVKKLIEQHNGEIWVESTEGKGSTFYFYLPCA